MRDDIVPVILCGGAGRRLRPLSRRSCPKPFLKCGSPHSMLQQTALRVSDCAAPVLILNHALRDRALRDVGAVGVQPQMMILEPAGRNTAPALAAASLLQPGRLLLMLPSDHWVGDKAILLAALDRAAPLARAGWIVSFGIRPDRAATRFGYIRRGPAVAEGIYRIARFIEKPPYATARALVRSGACEWNSGMILLSAETALAELSRFEPDLMQGVRKAVQTGRREGAFFLLGADFSGLSSRSVDVAVMERSSKSLVMPLALRWSDLGTWPAWIRRAAAASCARTASSSSLSSS